MCGEGAEAGAPCRYQTGTKEERSQCGSARLYGNGRDDSPTDSSVFGGVFCRRDILWQRYSRCKEYPWQVRGFSFVVENGQPAELRHRYRRLGTSRGR